MRAVVQRVKGAKVEVEGITVGECGNGLMVLLGAGKNSTEKDVKKLAGKVAGLRVFNDEEGKMNLGLADLDESTEAQVLVVSQFTLYGDVKSSRRPSFTESAAYDRGRELYELFVDELRDGGLVVETGKYGADMLLTIENDGPVTLMVEYEGTL